MGSTDGASFYNTLSDFTMRLAAALCIPIWGMTTWATATGDTVICSSTILIVHLICHPRFPTGACLQSTHARRAEASLKPLESKPNIKLLPEWGWMCLRLVLLAHKHPAGPSDARANACL